ncbi:uncharacterized protein LOC142578311 [Dermacentor variabilis]|uniref:uncharacterized protein LOC142578311 n=1 Tax=Dermacentor variabilis TaxID=34621 RepID=UPI003F5B191A
MDGNINTGKTGKILKHLLNPSGTKTVMKAEMTKLRHRYKGKIREICGEIVKLYLERPSGVEHRNYSGSPNADVGRDFSQQEIRAVLQTIKTKSAPGPDTVTNKMLRNLEDQAPSRLTDYINECWRNGEIPDEWKRSDVILIPKQAMALTTRLSSIRILQLGRADRDNNAAGGTPGGA